MKYHPNIALLTLPLSLPLALTPALHAQQAEAPIAAKPPVDDPQIKPPAILAKKDKKNHSTPLRVETLDVNVIVTGNTAETTMTMTFRNDTNRVLEGELVFPLGQGMTVSGYALDVNGKMRQGVIVEKQLARKVYEDTIRQQIDPGLVEWTKGNNFRTRIYPIPAKGTKKVSVSYVETLKHTDKQLTYQLPLAFKEKIKDFKLNINVVRPGGNKKVLIEDNAGIKLNMDDAKQWKINAHEKDFAANTSLKIAIPHEDMAKSLVFKNERDELFFYAVDTINQKTKNIDRPTPNTLHLIWDASNSGTTRNHAKEILLIESYLKKTKAKSLTLQFLRNELEAPQTFDLTKGLDPLLKSLRSVRYDGATQLNALNLADHKADATLLVTDGIATLGQQRPTVGTKPLFILHASQSAEHTLLDYLSAKTGGAYINLHNTSSTKGLTAMTSQRYSLLSITGEGTEDVYPSVATPVDKHASIAGKITADKPVTLTLKYGVAGKVMHTNTITIDPSKFAKDANKVPRLWAQKKLMELDAEAKKNRLDIIDIAQQHGIVTRFTSLLVLDRMEDYVKHRINPPEPELQEEYDRLLRQQTVPEADNAKHLSKIIGQYKQMIKWHQHKHPTVGDLLVAQTTRYNKHIENLGQQLKTQLQQAKEEATKTKLKASLAQIAKLQEIQKQATNWKTKNANPHAAPDANYHKVLKEYKDTVATLISRKGDKFKKGEVRALAGRDGAAPDARPQAARRPLNGNVIPAEAPEAAAFSLEAADDGFGGGAGGGAATGTAANFSFMASKSKNGAAPKQRNASATLAKWDPNTPYLKALRQAAKDGKNLEDTYFEWKPKYLRSSAFYLDVADFFFQQKQTKIGFCVLSNVAELDIESPALLRILGHRYDQLGKHDLAETIFREVLSLRTEEPQSYRDLALVLEKQEKFQEAAEKLWHVTSTKWDSRLDGIELIALTELNALIAKNPGTVDTSDFKKEAIYNLDADVRIILTWDADNTDIDLWVTGPLGEKCNYSHNRTKTGGRMSRDFTQGYGPEVFMIKNAINGEYKIQANYYGSRQQTLAGETTIQATLVTNWGRKNEKRQSITLRLKSKKEVVNVGSLNFSHE